MQILNPRGTATLLWWRGLKCPKDLRSYVASGLPWQIGSRWSTWWRSTQKTPMRRDNWTTRHIGPLERGIRFGHLTISLLLSMRIYSSSHLNCLQLSVKQLGQRSAPPGLKSCSSGRREVVGQPEEFQCVGREAVGWSGRLSGGLGQQLRWCRLYTSLLW